MNTLAMGLRLGTPLINTFSGKAMPSKMEVSFEQWYHEVQCIKDHYPESVVRESIAHSLKRAVADMARYMAPTTSIAHILQKLKFIFGTVALLDVLMQNFYKVTQSNHKKVPSFAMRLEGTLNQICGCSALEESQIKRYNSTSRIIFFMGYVSTSET